MAKWSGPVATGALRAPTRCGDRKAPLRHGDRRSLGILLHIPKSTAYECHEVQSIYRRTVRPCAC